MAWNTNMVGCTEEDARLAEAVKALARDRNRQPTGKSTSNPLKVLPLNCRSPELMTAVQASLRSKVASLQEDNWMYEAEEEF